VLEDGEHKTHNNHQSRGLPVTLSGVAPSLLFVSKNVRIDLAVSWMYCTVDTLILHMIAMHFCRLALVF